jgi:Pyruvate/2-oxoacid:ferredoxin oxidoreductase delta subunit
LKRSIRPIIRIDEDKCDGCGLCEKACHEGAIAVVDGKARLVSETYCDGLGACLGECPRGAIAIEDREAEEFDEEAARAQGLKQQPKQPACGCPGTMARSLKEMPLPDLRGRPFPVSGVSDRGPVVSRLGNWPVQLSLVPVDAPYLEGADLLLAADCSAFACPDFHERFLEGKVLLMGCPKLDDSAFYEEKVKAILARNRIKSVEVVTMEVPCCSSLVRLVQSAVEKQRLSLSLTLTTVGIRGEVIGKETIRYRFE